MRLRMAMAGALALLAAGCGKPRPPLPPVVVEPSQLDQLVYWSPDLDGRRIAIDGYIGFDNGPPGQAIALGPELTSQPYGKGDELIRFDLARGEGPNQLQLPVLETRSLLNIPAAGSWDIVDVGRATFSDAAGKAHPLSDEVRVTGRLVYIRAGAAGLLSDEDARSPTGRRLKPRLVDVTLESLAD